MAQWMPGWPSSPRSDMQRPPPISVPFMQARSGLIWVTISTGTWPPFSPASSPQ